VKDKEKERDKIQNSLFILLFSLTNNIYMFLQSVLFVDAFVVPIFSFIFVFFCANFIPFSSLPPLCFLSFLFLLFSYLHIKHSFYVKHVHLSTTSKESETVDGWKI
jgi:hypothetical protein